MPKTLEKLRTIPQHLAQHDRHRFPRNLSEKIMNRLLDCYLDKRIEQYKKTNTGIKTAIEYAQSRIGQAVTADQLRSSNFPDMPSSASGTLLSTLLIGSNNDINCIQFNGASFAFCLRWLEQADTANPAILGKVFDALTFGDDIYAVTPPEELSQLRDKFMNPFQENSVVRQKWKAVYDDRLQIMQKLKGLFDSEDLKRADLAMQIYQPS